MTPPLAFVWNEEGLRREGRRGLGAADWLGRRRGSWRRIRNSAGLAGQWGPDSILAWFGKGRGLGIRYGGRDEGGMEGRGAKGLSQQKCLKVKMEGRMRARSTKSTY